MKIPVQITFKELNSSPALEEVIRQRVAHLESVCPHAIGCRVLVEAPHHHHRKAANCHVRVDLTIPKHEVVGTADVAHMPGHDDVAGGIRDAFAAVERQAKEFMKMEQKPSSRERLADVME